MLRKSVSVTDADIQNILRNGNWVGNDGLGLSRSGRWIIVVTGKRGGGESTGRCEGGRLYGRCQSCRHGQSSLEEPTHRSALGMKKGELQGHLFIHTANRLLRERVLLGLNTLND